MTAEGFIVTAEHLIDQYLEGDLDKLSAKDAADLAAIQRLAKRRGDPAPRTLKAAEIAVPDLYKKIRKESQYEVAGPVGPKRPKRKSLAQKQGYRQASRTKSRRQYREGFGGIYHEYYARTKRPTGLPK